MELTAEERETIERGGLVRFVIPDSHIECVVLRQDMLDPLRLHADHSPCDPDELSALTAEVLDDEAWTKPG